MLVSEGWKLDVTRCGVDLEFIEYLLRAHGREPNLRIFHMGPGLHHVVGLSHLGRVLSITNSHAEHAVYRAVVEEEPQLAAEYTCIFGDIVCLPDLLPEFDYATLFHLGEMPDQRREAYRLRSDLEVIELLAAHSKNLVFYRGSSAFDRVLPLLKQWKGGWYNKTVVGNLSVWTK